MRSVLEVHWGQFDDPKVIERLVEDHVDALMGSIAQAGLTDTDVSATLRQSDVVSAPDVDRQLIDLLTGHGASAADMVALTFQGTDAARTRAIVRRALRTLINNGLITVVRQEDWPEYIYPDGRPEWDPK